jgi:hypothetical protein
VQPLVFDMHKFYLTALRPANKSLHMAEVISWIPQHFKTQYGISNFVRFMGETEKPTSAATGAATGAATSAATGTDNTRRVTTDGNSLSVTIDGDTAVGATAPQSPGYNDSGDNV